MYEKYVDVIDRIVFGTHPLSPSLFTIVHKEGERKN